MSSLSELVESLSAVERREAVRFLKSPFFNQRDDLVRLFELLCTNPQCDRRMCWCLVYEDKPYDDQRFRLLQSYLHKLLETFLFVSHQLDDSTGRLLSLSVAILN
jgi:hypothetical protein